MSKETRNFQDEIPPVALAGELQEGEENNKEDRGKIDDPNREKSSSFELSQIELKSKNNFSEKTKKVFSSLSEKGKDFFIKIGKKIDSSDIVQNASDRLDRDSYEKMTVATDKKLDELNRQKKGQEKVVVDGLSSIKKLQDEQENAAKLLAETGRELDSKTKENVATQIEKLESQIEKAKTETQKLVGQMEDTAVDRETFENKANQARERLTGRFQAKIDVNNETISEIRASHTDLSEAKKVLDTSIEKNVGNANKLKEGISATTDQGIKEQLNKAFIELTVEKVKFDKEKKDIDLEIKAMEVKISAYESINKKWQKKIDKVMPAEETDDETSDQTDDEENEEKKATMPISRGGSRSAGAVQSSGRGSGSAADYGGYEEYSYAGRPKVQEIYRPKVETYKFEDNNFEIDDEDGVTTKVYENGIHVTNPDGSSKMHTFENAPKRVVDKLKKLPFNNMEKFGVHKDLIEKVKNKKEKKEKEGKYTVGDLVYSWNYYAQNDYETKGLRLPREKVGENLGKEVLNDTEGQRIIKRLLAEKIGGKADGRMLTRTNAKKVEEFIAKTDIARSDIEE